MAAFNKRSINVKTQIQLAAVAAAGQQRSQRARLRLPCAASGACAAEPPCRGHFFSGFFPALTFPSPPAPPVFITADPEPGCGRFYSLLKSCSSFRLLLNVGLGMAREKSPANIWLPSLQLWGFTPFHEALMGREDLNLPIPLKLFPASST